MKDWTDLAACRGMNPELWFPLGDGAPARAVCARCPVADACLAWAFEIGATDGIVAGLDAEDPPRAPARGSVAKSPGCFPHPGDFVMPAGLDIDTPHFGG